MATVFWNSKEVLLIDYLPRGTTITVAHYFEAKNTTQKGDPKQTTGKLTKNCFYSTKMLV